MSLVHIIRAIHAYTWHLAQLARCYAWYACYSEWGGVGLIPALPRGTLSAFFPANGADEMQQTFPLCLVYIIAAYTPGADLISVLEYIRADSSGACCAAGSRLAF
jgi:hypothetical protein